MSTPGHVIQPDASTCWNCSAFLIRTAQEFTDQAIDMHDQMIGRLFNFNRSERREQQGFQQNAKAINDKVRLYAEVGKALIAAYQAKTDLGKALESVLGWDQFATTVEEEKRLVEPFDCDFLDEMRDKYQQIRQYSPTLLNTFRVPGRAAERLSVASDRAAWGNE